MSRTIGPDTVFNQVQNLGGDISDEGIIVQYEKASGGQKTIGGDVISAHENYDNRSGIRGITIDLEGYDGHWRLHAEKGQHHSEVTLFSLQYNDDGTIDKTRISTRNGVSEVMHEDDW